MNEPTRDIDRALENVLAWRANRATAGGLLQQINERIDMEPQRTSPALAIPRPGNLAWLLVLVALLAAIAVGAVSLVGARRGLQADASPAVPPTAPPAAAADVARICLTARHVPFDLANLQLTGTWTDGGATYYMRQIGNDLWITGPGRLFGEPGDHSAYVFKGTISGSTVHLDWAETGAGTPQETRTPPWGAGSMDLRIEAGSNGNAQLTSVAQTGTRLTGPGYTTFAFTPCTPESLTVPTATP